MFKRLTNIFLPKAGVQTLAEAEAAKTKKKWHVLVESACDLKLSYGHELSSIESDDSSSPSTDRSSTETRDPSEYSYVLTLESQESILGHRVLHLGTFGHTELKIANGNALFLAFRYASGRNVSPRNIERDPEKLQGYLELERTLNDFDVRKKWLPDMDGLVTLDHEGCLSVDCSAEMDVDNGPTAYRLVVNKVLTEEVEEYISPDVSSPFESWCQVEEDSSATGSGEVPSVDSARSPFSPWTRCSSRDRIPR